MDAEVGMDEVGWEGGEGNEGGRNPTKTAQGGG